MDSTLTPADVGISAELPSSTPEPGSLDLGWARWLATLLVAPLLILPWLGSDQATIAALAISVVFGLLLCTYFFHILIRRLQISLLEWIFVILVLGNLEGFLLTAPGVLTNVWFWAPLAPLLAVWILYATVLGVVQADLRNLQSRSQRILLIALQVLALAAPAMLIMACLLQLADIFPWLMGTPLKAWKGPLCATGVIGLGLRVWIHLGTRRAAKEISKK